MSDARDALLKTFFTTLRAGGFSIGEAMALYAGLDPKPSTDADTRTAALTLIQMRGKIAKMIGPTFETGGFYGRGR